MARIGDGDFLVVSCLRDKDSLDGVEVVFFVWSCGVKFVGEDSDFLAWFEGPALNKGEAIKG